MNVGDYIRIDGYISKIEHMKTSTSGKTYVQWKQPNGLLANANIKLIEKTSPQIIDLIEVGDFITYKQGNFYWNIFEQVSARYNRENQMTDLIVDNKPLNTVEILTVITHEQMETMQYRVEE